MSDKRKSPGTPPTTSEQADQRRRPRKNKRRRGSSVCPPPSQFMPSEEHRASLQVQVLELLKECGSAGVTRLEASLHLGLCFPQHIHGLREMGCEIKTEIEEVGRSRLGRYFLISTSPASAPPRG